MHWLGWYWWLTGARDESGRAYGFWSGFGGSIPDFLILGGIVTLYRHHNCHVKGCPWIGRHEYEKDGVTFKVCKTHHPAISAMPTAAELREHHAAKKTDP